MFVTSQEGHGQDHRRPHQTAGNGFSKIQARFSVKVKLTSQDVEEVISKRLLERTLRAPPISSRSTPGKHELPRRSSTSSTARRHTATTSTKLASSTPYPFVTYQIPDVPGGDRGPGPTTTCSRARTALSASAPCSASSKKLPNGLATSRLATCHLRPDVCGHQRRAEIYGPERHPPGREAPTRSGFRCQILANRLLGPCSS